MPVALLVRLPKSPTRHQYKFKTIEKSKAMFDNKLMCMSPSQRVFKLFLLILCVGLLFPIQTIFASEPILPLPQGIELNKKLVQLGNKLFHEPALSKNNSISCASCHNIKMGGDDGMPVSIGVGGARGGRNSPTVLNSGLLFAYFWDGRAATLEEQAEGPIHNPIEMASNWEEVTAKLSANSEYVKLFNQSFEDGITSKNIQTAIATFERSLITPNAPIDRYLQGDENALSDEQKKGYQLFKDYGCSACHQGVLIGGNMFQKIGIFRTLKELEIKEDLGRFMVTKNPADKYSFKVPSLRNIALTAPYFHDGQTSNLTEAVKIMAAAQLGQEIPDSDIKKIVAFLHALTGDIPDPHNDNN